MTPTQLHGLLLLDKPQGWTSFDVVAYTRGIIQRAGYKLPGKKMYPVGHTGTLDPMATGLLIILVGDYCKRSQEFTKADKIYTAQITLGKTSDTDDTDGEVADMTVLEVPQEQVIVQALSTFVGKFDQLPPDYSAKKINGKKAYELARHDIKPQLQTKEIEVYSISDIYIKYPIIDCVVSVSSGTYIRSIARDLGNLLQCGGVLSGLRRDSIGDRKLADAAPIKDLSIETIVNRLIVC
jgi:tRNA pseudouridine55 synthase